MRTNIALIGYRTSGKTTVARALAALLGWQRIEFDALLEQRFGMSISAFVEDHGWPLFRAYESWLIHGHLSRSWTVLDLGGGAVLSRDTMTRVRAACVVVYLRCREETLLRRMLDGGFDATRPPLTRLSPKEEVKQTLRDRRPLYRADADLILDTDRSDPDETVHRLLRALLATDIQLPEMEVS